MGVYDVTIKEWTELPDDLPDESNDSWSFGRGGDGLPDRQWCIQHYEEDSSSTRYKLPLFISDMMELQKTWAKEEMQRKFKCMMGIRS